MINTYISSSNVIYFYLYHNLLFYMIYPFEDCFVHKKLLSKKTNLFKILVKIQNNFFFIKDLNFYKCALFILMIDLFS